MKKGLSMPVLKSTFKANSIWPLRYASGPDVKLFWWIQMIVDRRILFYLLSGSFSSSRVVKNITMGTPKVSPEVESEIPTFRELTLSWEIVKCTHGVFKEEYFSKSSSESSPSQNRVKFWCVSFSSTDPARCSVGTSVGPSDTVSGL